MPGRDALFQELFGCAPNQEELQRFDRIGSLMELSADDSLWYFILVNEFYDDRMKNRLAEIDRVTESAVNKALTEIAETAGKNLGGLSSREGKGAGRSWALGFIVLLCAVMFNSGYVMGSGASPLWPRPESGFRRVIGWLLNVPSGWIVLLGSGSYLFEIYWDSTKKITANKRFGIERKENIALYVKSLASLLGMGLIVLLVLYLTGLNATLQ
jgi:hypothetical protein